MASSYEETLPSALLLCTKFKCAQGTAWQCLNVKQGNVQGQEEASRLATLSLGSLSQLSLIQQRLPGKRVLETKCRLHHILPTRLTIAAVHLSYSNGKSSKPDRCKGQHKTPQS